MVLGDGVKVVYVSVEDDDVIWVVVVMEVERVLWVCESESESDCGGSCGVCEDWGGDEVE